LDVRGPSSLRGTQGPDQLGGGRGSSSSPASPNGSRKVTEIARSSPHGREQFRIATVSATPPTPLGADRVVHGRFEHLPVPRPVAEKLYVANEPLPPAYGVTEGHRPAQHPSGHRIAPRAPRR
ncbi:hypothetical protein QBA75_09320, partial [Streptomyces stelliscabiei]